MNYELGLVDVADLGQLREQVGQNPHQERGEQNRPRGLRPQLDQRDDALVSGSAHQIVRIDFGFAEERVAAVGLQIDQRTQDHARRRRRHTAEVLQVRLALIAGQVRDDRAQIFQVLQWQLLLVCPVEDQSQRGFLGGIEPQHL
ncbi:Uncharacterised protein [Mycobacteroides abscessus subsp. bolletii]|nr:Uncharacterised protein [Mycobacteroides abscessus subsp. bolletii]